MINLYRIRHIIENANYFVFNFLAVKKKVGDYIVFFFLYRPTNLESSNNR